MLILSKEVSFHTKEGLEFIDFTDQIQEFVGQSQVKNGLLNIQTMHTTCSLLLNENEPLLLEDFKKHLAELSEKGKDYNHNDFTRRTVNMCLGECQNGHAHCQAIHLPSTLTLNVIKGKMQLGQWQRIFAVELDRGRARKIQLQIIGE